MANSRKFKNSTSFSLVRLCGDVLASLCCLNKSKKEEFCKSKIMKDSRSVLLDDLDVMFAYGGTTISTIHERAGEPKRQKM